MKRIYIKPQITFDSFSVDTDIAACASQALHDVGTCTAIIAGRTVFVSEVAACKFKAKDGTYGICYYTPNLDNNVFGS